MYLNVSNISKSYNEHEAVKDISFSVKQGTMLCLLGPSGCGKSTVLKAIGGFIKVDAGRIFLDGKDITDEPPENRTVSTVFQSYGLFPHINVLGNIIYGLKFQHIPKKQRIAMGMEMMEIMGLSGYEKKHIGELSGGEQQRVALARSLIIKPKLLLLDEPLSNLDAKLRISMRKEIKRIQKEFTITTIFVTHDQSEAFELADSIVLLNKGRIMQEGTAQELYNKPKNGFVLDFIGSHNKIDGTIVRPERIKVMKLPEAAPPDSLTAHITEVVFKGEVLELQLTVHDTDVKALVLNDGTVYEKGETVALRLI